MEAVNKKLGTLRFLKIQLKLLSEYHCSDDDDDDDDDDEEEEEEDSGESGNSKIGAIKGPSAAKAVGGTEAEARARKGAFVQDYLQHTLCIGGLLSPGQTAEGARLCDQELQSRALGVLKDMSFAVAAKMGCSIDEYLV